MGTDSLTLQPCKAALASQCVCVHSHGGTVGSAGSCGAGLWSSHTSPQTRADWPVLCTEERPEDTQNIKY